MTFKREENRIITITENQGLSLKVITTIEDKPKEVYVALTGDQCAITGIRVSNP
ncbi:MAG: hypothetical protein IJ589_05375 [Lachnospiraceae bacterium]|nr:hypothetical protein [Lachnospiraceae bacterium]